MSLFVVVIMFVGNCAMLNIPGFTFPVRQFLLEDVLELLQSVFASVCVLCCLKNNNFDNVIRVIFTVCFMPHYLLYGRSVAEYNGVLTHCWVMLFFQSYEAVSCSTRCCKQFRSISSQSLLVSDLVWPGIHVTWLHLEVIQGYTFWHQWIHVLNSAHTTP